MLTWLDQRTGVVTATKDFLTEDVPGGASYWYAFGSATVFAMIIQIVTGMFLTLYYSPAASTAWASTLYIYQKVPFGKFIISMHYWGASAMIAFMAMHLLQVLIWGAYKKPRELQWIVGVVLFLLTIVLGLTGYLLPWDQNAFLASQVAIQIAGSVPIVGNATVAFLQDGATLGTLTINRFFGIHVWLVPAVLIGLVGAHLAIFRWNGAAGPPLDEAPKLKPGRFWPDQMFMDIVVSFAMFAVIVVLALIAPPILDARADPNDTAFIAYPAWYFLALFDLLTIVGKFPDAVVPTLDLVATVIFPGLLVGVLVLLPFIDRNPSRRISRRPWILGVTALTMVGAIGLSLHGQIGIQVAQASVGYTPPDINSFAAPAAVTTTGTTAGTAAASTGMTAGTTVASTGGAGGSAALPGMALGATVYTANCSGCHAANGAGLAGQFPPLAKNDYTTGDVKAVIHTLNYGLVGKIKVNGADYNGQMPAWKGQLKDAEIAAVITYIRNSWGNKGSAVTAADVAAGAK